MKVSEIFDQVAAQMQSDFQRSRVALSHPGLKGSSFEEIFRQFLREYLPRSLDISTGVLVDAGGKHSRQLDVIISDTAKTPIFYRNGDIRVIPVECAYCVIEVKANLDTRELENSFQNMKSVRELRKTAYYLNPKNVIRHISHLYGQEWEIWPVNYFLFAFDSIDLGTIAASLDLMHQQDALPEWSRIDTICVLDKGVICNRSLDGKFSALPEPQSIIYTCMTSRALLLFYTLITHFLLQVSLPNFRFTNYLGQMKFEQNDR